MNFTNKKSLETLYSRHIQFKGNKYTFREGNSVKTVLRPLV